MLIVAFYMASGIDPRRLWISMLAANIGDEICWWQAWYVVNRSDRFHHQHSSFIISVKHPQQKSPIISRQHHSKTMPKIIQQIPFPKNGALRLISSIKPPNRRPVYSILSDSSSALNPPSPRAIPLDWPTLRSEHYLRSSTKHVFKKSVEQMNWLK